MDSETASLLEYVQSMPLTNFCEMVTAPRKQARSLAAWLRPRSSPTASWSGCNTRSGKPSTPPRTSLRRLCERVVRARALGTQCHRIEPHLGYMARAI